MRASSGERGKLSMYKADLATLAADVGDACRRPRALDPTCAVEIAVDFGMPYCLTECREQLGRFLWIERWSAAVHDIDDVEVFAFDVANRDGVVVAVFHAR